MRYRRIRTERPLQPAAPAQDYDATIAFDPASQMNSLPPAQPQSGVKTEVFIAGSDSFPRAETPAPPTPYEPTPAAPEAYEDFSATQQYTPEDYGVAASPSAGASEFNPNETVPFVAFDQAAAGNAGDFDPTDDEPHYATAAAVASAPAPVSAPAATPVKAGKKKGSGGKMMMIIAIIAVLGVLAIGGVGGGYYYYANYMAAEPTPEPTLTPMPSPSETPMATPSPEPTIESNTNSSGTFGSDTNDNTSTVEPTPTPSQSTPGQQQPRSTPVVTRTPARTTTTPPPAKTPPPPKKQTGRTDILQ